MLSNNHTLNRRHFMTHVAGATAMTVAGSQLLGSLVAANAASPGAVKKSGKHFILLNMQGGPTHMDTWTIKEGSPNKGSFDAIQTSAEGVKIASSMPKMAEVMKHMVKIESMNSAEGDHARGQFKWTSMGKTPSTIGVNLPSSISAMSALFGDPDAGLQCVAVGGGGNPGFLGNKYAAFNVQNPGVTPENILPPAMGDEKMSLARRDRQIRMLNVLEGNYTSLAAPHLTKLEDRKAYQDYTLAHQELVEKAVKLSKAGRGNFEFDAKDQADLTKIYGGTGFGRSCLLARKMCEAGVTAVQLNLGGWDMHGGIKEAVDRQVTGNLDGAFAGLVKDLVDRGLWNDTVVLWAGDFGRTPRINMNAGRDHWGNGWTVVVGGGGLKGGMSYGETDKDGMSIRDKMVTPAGLYGTILETLGFDTGDINLEWHTNLGTRLKHAGENDTAKANAPIIKDIMGKKA